MIVKSGNKWEVRSADGSKLLGTHTSRASAIAQLIAIEAAKKYRSKR